MASTNDAATGTEKIDPEDVDLASADAGADAGADPDDEANAEAETVAARRGGRGRRGRSAAPAPAPLGAGAPEEVKALVGEEAIADDGSAAPVTDAVGAPAPVPGGPSFDGPGTSGNIPAVAPVPAGPMVGDTVHASLPVTPQRSHYAALDPQAPSTSVAEVSPFAPAGAMAGYVRAPCDAYEALYPSGCKTPVSRTLWHKEQRVPADQYAAWARQQPGGGPAPLPDGPPAGHELTRQGLSFDGSGFSVPSSI